MAGEEILSSKALLNSMISCVWTKLLGKSLADFRNHFDTRGSLAYMARIRPPLPFILSMKLFLKILLTSGRSVYPMA
jgi:hypothetical protein